LVLVAVSACRHDVTSPGAGAIRFLVVQGSNRLGQTVVEFQGPPMVARRSMPTFTSDSGMYVLARNGTGGGFYAWRFAGSIPNVAGWKLVRYDDDWRIAATYSDTASPTQPYLQLTPDGRYLVANIIGGTRSLLVLDAVTLAVIHRSVQPLYLWDQGAASAATGSQVLLTSPNAGECPVSLVWWDVSTGSTADSTAMPCDYVLLGALSSRRVYRRGPQSGTPLTELYDITAAAILATADSVAPLFWPYVRPASGRLVVFEGGDAAVVDPQTLTLFGRVSTGTGVLGPRFVNNSITDPSTGDVIGATADPVVCVGCVPSPDGIVVIDATNLKLLADQRLSTPVQLVH
jgi:hypothetical protein